jgi:hypothetical protein
MSRDQAGKSLLEAFMNGPQKQIRQYIRKSADSYDDEGCHND